MENQEVISNNEKTICSDKSFSVTALLCFYLGSWGFHRFYVGKIGTAILQFILSFLGFLGIVLSIVLSVFNKKPVFLLACLFAVKVWVLIDFIFILCKAFMDKKGLPVKPVDKIQMEEFITLFFSILSIEFLIIGWLSSAIIGWVPSFDWLKAFITPFFFIFELAAIFLAFIPFVYGIIGIIVKGERNVKLFGFITSISVFLITIISLACFAR